MNESTESKEAQHGMVLPKDGLRELALFAGAGGGILGGLLHGWRTVAAVEIEYYPRRVLLQRQADGILPRFPIWDDVCTFDGKPWRGKVDVVSGGFPCQDISCAGKGEGITGSRSGLWGEMARIIREVGPRFVFVENSPMLTVRGLGVVLGGLAEMGYDARWGVLGARDAGAPHKRDRIWIMADAKSAGAREDNGGIWEGAGRTGGGEESSKAVADTLRQGLQGTEHGSVIDQKRRQEQNGPVAERGCSWWDQDPADVGNAQSLHGERPECVSDRERDGQGEARGTGGSGSTKPAVGRVAHGVAHRVDRLKAIGNGQVPQCAALAWQILTDQTEQA